MTSSHKPSETRASFTPHIIKGLFSDDERRPLFEYLNSVRRNLDRFAYDGEIFHRHQIHKPSVLVPIHAKLIEKAESIFAEKLKPSYSFLSMYSNKGICPEHVDRPMCAWTIDYCLSQKRVWPIYVQNVPYLLEENDALCYSGTSQPHYRKQIEFDNSVDMAFFHFVPVDYEGELD